MNKYPRYDVVVIGGGVYGCLIALELEKYFSSVLILEKEADLMQRASYVNQARVHNGYHYPRSILTAWRSRINFGKFIDRYADCIVSDFDNYYAVAKKFSHINARQFKIFCDRIDARLEVASKSVQKLFNPSLIEAVFRTQEYVFNAVKLKDKIIDRLREAKVEIRTRSPVQRIQKSYDFPGQIEVAIAYSPGLKNQLPSSQSDTDIITTKYVFNCTYSALNTILSASNLSTISLKHEFAEMALIEVPQEIKNWGITIMCGPFFSLMPFPALGLHTFSHVRYTPHFSWQDSNNHAGDSEQIYLKSVRKTNYPYMIRDAQRYLNILKDCIYVNSLWEIKTILPQSEIDDSRPILFQKHQQLPALISVLGGKIDNIYDVNKELQLLYARGSNN